MQSIIPYEKLHIHAQPGTKINPSWFLSEADYWREYHCRYLLKHLLSSRRRPGDYWRGYADRVRLELYWSMLSVKDSRHKARIEFFSLVKRLGIKRCREFVV